MFKAGDTVLYGSEGVCIINEITERSFGNVTAQYYVLSPIFNDRSTVFVPVENEALTSKMHIIIREDNILDLLSSVPPYEDWPENDSQRKDNFKNIIASGETPSLISLYKMIEGKAKELAAIGKKLHKSDESALKEVQKILCQKIAVSMKISREATMNFFMK